jgi:hypothetical protein
MENDELSNIWGDSPKRAPIPASIKKQAYARAKGKCEKCGLSFGLHRIRPNYHHRNAKPKDNRLSNIRVLYPNCHSKSHRYITVRETNMFGFTSKRKKLVGEKRKRRKTKKKKKRQERSIFDW